MNLKTFIGVLIILVLSIQPAFAALPYPVIFVHGIGDSSAAWKETGPRVSMYYDKYYKTAEHPYFSSGSGIGKDRYDKDFSDNLRDSCVYITFSDHFASPDKLLPELEEVISYTREEIWRNFKGKFKSKEDIKVNLVCHSMAGLIARKYLEEHPHDHYVSKLITIGTPNLGSEGLLFNWAPVGLIITGIGGTIIFANPYFLILTVGGLSADVISRLRGVKLLSPAVEAMKPGSEFLKGLNSRPLPTDVEYVGIISNTTEFSHVLANQILMYDGGDGAVSIKSQKLSEESVPNFSEIDYSEIYIDSPHFQEPTDAAEAIIKALNF